MLSTGAAFYFALGLNIFSPQILDQPLSFIVYFLLFWPLQGVAVGTAVGSLIRVNDYLSQVARNEPIMLTQLERYSCCATLPVVFFSGTSVASTVGIYIWLVHWVTLVSRDFEGTPHKTLKAQAMAVSIDLTGKRGVIFGVANPRSIAWAIAERLAEAGAELAFTYQNERLKAPVEKAISALDNPMLLECDATVDSQVQASNL